MAIENVERDKKLRTGTNEADWSGVRNVDPSLLGGLSALKYAWSSLPCVFTMSLLHRYVPIPTRYCEICKRPVLWSTEPRMSRAAWSKCFCVGCSVIKSKSMFTSSLASWISMVSR